MQKVHQYHVQLQCAARAPLPWEKLKGRSVLITGASGMVGSALVDLLLQANREHALQIKLFACARNTQALQKRFAQSKEQVQLFSWDVCDPFPLAEHLDYMVHAASNSDPMAYVKYPADTLRANILGTDALLSYGRMHSLERFLFVSSGEMYGQPDENSDGFEEAYSGYVDYSNPRACYPAGKRAAEMLCQTYAAQYGMNIGIVRPCHLYGPTMTQHDTRAISHFLRRAAAGQDIVLKSKGTLERSHCYVVDATLAMLYVLLLGQPGAAYNIADPAGQMSIHSFAQKIAEITGKKIVFDLPDEQEKKGFSPIVRAVLSSSKIRALGFAPLVSPEEGIRATLQALTEAL